MLADLALGQTGERVHAKIMACGDALRNTANRLHDFGHFAASAMLFRVSIVGYRLARSWTMWRERLIVVAYPDAVAAIQAEAHCRASSFALASITATEDLPLIRLEPFRPELMDEIALRWPDILGSPAIVRDAVANGHGHNAKVAFVGDKPVGAGGVVQLLPGVGLAWIAVSRLPPVLAVAAVRACRNGLDEIQARGKFHRVQADIRRDFLEGRRLALMLGFSYEGPMDGYASDKSDYDRYAKVRK